MMSPGRRQMDQGFGPPPPFGPRGFGRSMRPGMMSPGRRQMDQEMSPVEEEEPPFSPQQPLPARKATNTGSPIVVSVQRKLFVLCTTHRIYLFMTIENFANN
ncbi:hypothetical protein CRM22_007814 [Opisthorchis felineus]|uniref:Uncharacterized protein n=1 Tax=Opisthorchis felineus TaxID=147828 RepID=A0A4V3SDR9_OPIFE|nr:hypothetical protein CRM22_007814 [Opisthorchis felineus]